MQITNDSLKSQATKGMIWNALEKFSVQAGQLVIGIVLARILMPEDFGLIGMLSIFIAISQTFIDSGMETGLIQKKNKTDIDFSTVFIFNFVVSASFYLILYFTAPLIADFYEMPQLVLLTRILSINIVINSLAIIQRSKLTINIDFKTIAKVNVVSVFISGGLGILFAILGYGVWALVIQQMSNAVVSVVMFWFLSKWKPSLLFSMQSFKELFGFGSKLLLSGLYAQTINNIYNIAIGKVFTASELGFFTRAKSFAELTAGTITSVLHQVSFPILSSLQDDRERMVRIFGRMIRMSAFFIFPAMSILAMVADPFINLVLTEKWAPTIPLLQWMCFARIFYPMSAINMNILNAIGRSDLFLKVDLSKFPIIVTALIITIPLGVKAMVIGQVVSSFLSFIINTYLSGKLFGYGAIAQLRDILPILVSSAFAALSIMLTNLLFDGFFLKMSMGILIGLAVFVFSAYLLKIEELKEVNNLLRYRKIN
jgi:O-antigen/teichoic acid export membrane protein